MVLLVAILLGLALSDEETDDEEDRREKNRIQREELLKQEHELRDKLIWSMRRRGANAAEETIKQEEQWRAELDKNQEEQSRLRDELIAGIKPMVDRKLRKISKTLKQDVPEGERKRDIL
jgi:hypothetical protein